MQLSPFDSYLMIRGIKTLAVRMERQQENAMKIAQWLKQNDRVEKVYYVGLPEHPGYEINKKQARGFGAMISFTLKDEKTARKILENVKVFSLCGEPWRSRIFNYLSNASDTWRCSSRNS